MFEVRQFIMGYNHQLITLNKTFGPTSEVPIHQLRTYNIEKVEGCLNYHMPQL